MKTKYLIFASQDYEKANHKGLWDKIAEKFEKDTVIVNIPADKVVSKIKKHTSRIEDAKKGAVEISEHLTVIRPMLTLRPELVPRCFYKQLAKELWKSIRKTIPDIDDCFLNVIVYNAFWTEILKGSRANMKIAYYLFDEVRRNGKDNTINKKRYLQDEFACKNCDVVFTMTKVLAESRKEYNENIVVMGNGADKDKADEGLYSRKFEKSAAFIGNFRNWIDNDMLESVIETLSDVLFVFVGTVDEDMREYFVSILNKYPNTVYFGGVQKKHINALYKSFDCVIIPYKNNEFIKATRPIKIVESVLAGTPVVTIPMDGYEQSAFIRYAENANDFAKEISFLIENGLDKDSDEYKDFVKNNTWEAVAQNIILNMEQ